MALSSFCRKAARTCCALAQEPRSRLAEKMLNYHFQQRRTCFAIKDEAPEPHGDLVPQRGSRSVVEREQRIKYCYNCGEEGSIFFTHFTLPYTRCYKCVSKK